VRIMAAVKRLLVVLALAMNGQACKHVNRATLVASTAAVACDWGHTRSYAAAGWPGVHESNPIMGREPTTGTVDLYFAYAIAANALVWLAMPEKYRSVVPIAVLGVQANTVARDVRVDTLTTCGL
jgi:hypothetical protein